MNTRSKDKINLNLLHSATSLINYIRSDCIIDFFEIVKKNNYEIDLNNNFKLKKRKISDIEDNNIKKSSFDYIVEDGYKFEKEIINKIKNKLIENNEISKLKEIYELNTTTKYNITIETLLSKKYDIITGALLINKSNNTYGYPDLIVSGYWITKYINNYPIGISSDRNLYYIIDIKSSIIRLTNGGENISNGSLFNSYKAQIYIYTEAINNILATNNNIGFILGKKYQYITNNKKISINNSFERLGIINYAYEESIDNNYFDFINKAINWKNNINKNWKNIRLLPINNDNIYPNMKNIYDKNYKKLKKEVAFANKEITLLWNCGIKNRNIAWSNNIKKYDDARLNPSLLGFSKESSIYNILNEIIKINNSKEKKKFKLDYSNNHLDWQNKKKYEFFVDFETYSKDISEEDLNEEFINITNQCIYMIGVNYEENHMNKFKCFIIKFNNCNETEVILKQRTKLYCNIDSYIYCDNEKDLIIKFVDFINSFNKKKSLKDFYNNIRLIHWSSAESIIFNKKLLEYNLDDTRYILNWYDLLLIFKYKNSPIVIKDCFGFSLKQVIKTLNKHNLINLNWTDLDDGLLSSFIAEREIYIDNNIDINNIIDIVEYNYIDCLALNKILEWMRNNI